METSILVAAKKEYTDQLEDILVSGIHNVFKRNWTTKKTLKDFQKSLCDIPEWNQRVINNTYITILAEKDIASEYFEKIIEAVFLSNIKILSVVKLKNKKQTINISIPETKGFVHKCVIEVAREFYQDPHLIDDRVHKSEYQRNIKRIQKIVKDCIEKTIRGLIPMEQILNKYLEAHSDSGSDNEEDQQETLKQSADNAFVPQPQPQPQPQPPQESEFAPTNEEPLFIEEPTHPQPQPQQPEPEHTVDSVFESEPIIVNIPQQASLEDEHEEDADFFTD